MISHHAVRFDDRARLTVNLVPWTPDLRAEPSAQGAEMLTKRFAVFMRTSHALKPGQKFTSTSGVTVQVKSAIPGGFTVHIERPADPRCADILRKIANIDEELNKEGLDVNERKRLLIARGQLETQAQQLGCSS